MNNVKKHGFWFASIILIMLQITVLYAGDGALLRFPDVHEDNVVFVHGEDIWMASVNGGPAVRLTMHDGQERFPKFSNDGKHIAFTGEYDGNGDIYIMNADGSNIRRVTWHPGYDIMIGWHPLKKKILFSSGRHSYSRFNRLFLISPDGTGLEELILNEAFQGCFSPDGKAMAYNKVSRENRTWKRYQGGTAQEVYIYNFETNEEINITGFKGTDRLPMWIGDTIYFSSDRNRTLNIYAYDTASRKTKQITSHSDYDIRRPSAGGNSIVYEVGGKIWLLNTETGETREMPITIQADAPETRPYLTRVDDLITGFGASSSGKRAVIAARGEIFTVPKKDGPTRNLSGSSSGAREKDPAWSPDGKLIAFISDQDGEYNIYIQDPSGLKPPAQLTRFKQGYRHTLRWSPDSRKIAFADQTLSLFVLDVATKKVKKIDRAEYENVDVALDLKPIYDFAWSPDSRYLTYSKMTQELIYQIYIAEAGGGKAKCVSNSFYNDFHPVFSGCGKYLFFVSNRRFDPTFCDFEWEMVYKKAADIYVLSLQKAGDSFLPFKSDEEETGEADSKNEDEKKITAIDFDGIASRVEPLPLPRGNYRNLAVNDNALYFLNRDEGDFNRFEFRVPGTMDLHAFSFDSHEEETVIEGISGYSISSDGSTIIYRKANTVGLIAASTRKSSGKALSLSGLKMHLNPRAEWKQIFNESWRMERDFYYDPGMHGLDWNAMKIKYGKLMSQATCRQDVQFIIGELIGELNTSHTYVFGGDQTRSAGSVNVGMLGCDWSVDAKANRFRITKIYNAPDWTRNTQPPLIKPGLNIKPGDYVLQVNGREITADRNIYSYFQDLAGKPVSLLINNKPLLKDARTVVVKPLSRENGLRYFAWVEHNRMVCGKASGGQIGYMHLPDTYLGSSVMFPQYFYAQMNKKGLIIDGRFNGGGLDPDIFLRRLDKPVHAYWTRRYSHDQTIPDFVTRAHMVCLTNRQAGSGGDMLPMEFRKRKMGPIVGTRTWGGLVGVSMWLSMVDGGGLSAPDYRIYDHDGNWIVENEGVTPDHIVDLHPAEMARGHDAQLMRGIELLKGMIEKDPLAWPKHKSFPVDK